MHVNVNDANFRLVICQRTKRSRSDTKLQTFWFPQSEVLNGGDPATQNLVDADAVAAIWSSTFQRNRPDFVLLQFRESRSVRADHFPFFTII